MRQGQEGATEVCGTGSVDDVYPREVHNEDDRNIDAEGCNTCAIVEKQFSEVKVGEQIPDSERKTAKEMEIEEDAYQLEEPTTLELNTEWSCEVEDVCPTGGVRHDDRLTGRCELESTPTVEIRGTYGEAEIGNVLDVLEITKEVREVSAEQGAAERVQDICMQVSCVVSDASTMLEDGQRQ